MILKNEDMLREVVINIMTEMFFIFPDMDDEGLPLDKKEATSDFMDVMIHFHAENQLHFRIEYGMLREMAANFLGLMPEEVDEDNLKAAALETANIIGGNFLVEIDPDKEFSLSIPAIVKKDDCLPQEERQWSISFVSDDSAIIIWPQPRTQ